MRWGAGACTSTSVYLSPSSGHLSAQALSSSVSLGAEATAHQSPQMYLCAPEQHL